MFVCDCVQLVRLLQRLGFAAEGVENGQLCIDIFERHRQLQRQQHERGGPAVPGTPIEEPFDVILLDNFMPVKTGEDSARELRAMGVRCAIIGLTGNALPEDMDRFKQAGANHVLTKPVDCKALREALVPFDRCRKNSNSNGAKVKTNGSTTRTHSSLRTLSPAPSAFSLHVTSTRPPPVHSNGVAYSSAQSQLQESSAAGSI